MTRAAPEIRPPFGEYLLSVVYTTPIASLSSGGCLSLVDELLPGAALTNMD